MLQTMREASKGWVATVLMGLLVLSFALWGINDIFSGQSSTAIAKVGNAEISRNAYLSELQRRMRRLSEQSGIDLNPEQMRALGLDRQVLQEMVAETAIDEYAADLGLYVSDTQVLNAIHAIEAFKGITGEFDRSLFVKALQANGFTEAQLVEAIRGDLVKRQLLGAAFSGIEPPPGMVSEITQFENERRVAEYFVIPSSRAEDVADPGDEVLQKFLEANAQTYTSPEYRAVAVLAIDPANYLNQVQVTEEELKELYEALKPNFIVPEKRTLEQISFATEEEAKAARAKITAGATFLGIAEEMGLKAEDIALGEVSAGDASVPESAFKLDAGAVSEAEQGPFGWVLIRVLSITPGSEKTFEEVKPDLRAQLGKERATDLIYQISNAVEDDRAGGKTLEEAAAAHGLTLAVTPAIDAAGLDPSGTKVEGVFAKEDILAAIFAADAGQETDMATSSDGTQFVVRIDGTTPPVLKPLSAVREQVLDAYMTAMRLKAITDVAKDAITKANGGVPFADVAKEFEAEVKTAKPVSRGGNSEELPPQLVQQLFGLSAGTAAAWPTADQKGFVIARVTEVRPAKGEEEGELMAADALETMRRGMSSDIAEAIASESQRRAGVSINETMLEQVFNSN